MSIHSCCFYPTNEGQLQRRHSAWSNHGGCFYPTTEGLLQLRPRTFYYSSCCFYPPTEGQGQDNQLLRQLSTCCSHPPTGRPPQHNLSNQLTSVVFTLQTKGCYNSLVGQDHKFTVVFTLQTKGSYNVASVSRWKAHFVTYFLPDKQVVEVSIYPIASIFTVVGLCFFWRVVCSAPPRQRIAARLRIGAFCHRAP